MPIVLDACAIIAYLRNEQGADIVESVLLNDTCVAHAINLYEVYKDCLVRGESEVLADEILDDLESIGLGFREDMDPAMWKRAATLKMEIGRISIADCLALTLSERIEGTLYTSDHHELDPVEAQGIISIRFIR